MRTSILAYEWNDTTTRSILTGEPCGRESGMPAVPCTKVGLMHRILVAIHRSVIVLQQMFNEHKHAFPEAPKRHFGSPGYSTLLLRSVWSAFFDRCLIKLPTGEYVSPQYCGSWTLESSSLCHYPTTIIALNRSIRDGVSYVSCLTPIPEEWLIERDCTLSTIARISSAEMCIKTCRSMQKCNTYVPQH